MYCVGGRHKSGTFDTIEYQKLNPKTRKVVRVKNVKSGICGCSKSKISTKQMPKGNDFEKKGNCTNGKCLPLSNSAWWENKDGTILKLHDLCPNTKCKGQNQLTLNPRQFHLEGFGFLIMFRKEFKGPKLIRIVSSSLRLMSQRLVNGMAVGAETKNPHVA